ncbi:uncharacterized protein G2W53_023685 [Senna tora]|uniref:SANT domain-containing protein n=1 Tax=Senna tora TaxID=362788 RepID=A0A834TBI0_9FABA|nr:uncharacterized protein G2W53_023685 [Senna tora]
MVLYQQMGVLCPDYGTEGTEGKSGEGSSTSGSSDMDDKFGEPEVVPRVGDEYQADIPQLISVPGISQLLKKFRDSEVTVNLPKSLGLPISLMWAYCKAESSCETAESVISEEGQVISENNCPQVKFEPMTAALLGEGKNARGFLNFQSSFKCGEMGIDSYRELKLELDQAKEMSLLPGSSAESWTVIEYNSFLLGLYVFGKNFNLVKRFVGSKNMGDLLSFYYGKFYKSEGYRRWSDCRKLKNKRCISGQKIFTGWRQQELLSRLFSHVSKECQNTLVELSRNFSEGKMPFQEYVFTLRDTVGIGMLIDAVGIGKGKQDLTGTSVEPTKMSHIFSVRPEIPIGKACSSLTSAEIIKFLTGGFRLSKARSSDLFWEAVWPRLLAKGWRSEQPKDYAVSGSKPSLVFLTPGVKKFSRWKLVKGNHYFDSVSDVLNKVASEPGLLESEVQVSDGGVDRVKRQEKQDLDGVSNKQQCHYLQPLSSNCNQMKFTIVDTSLVCDLEKRKVRELRSLPIQNMNMSTLMSESEQDTSEDTEDQAEQTNSSSTTENFSDKVASKDCTYRSEVLNADEVAVENPKCHSDLQNDRHAKETDKFQFLQNVTSGWSNNSPSINPEELSHCTESTTPMERRNLDLNVSASPLDLCDASDQGLVLSVDLQNVSSLSSQAKENPKESDEGYAIQKHPEQEICAEKPETRMLIDLNLPHVSPEFGTEIEMAFSSDNQCASTSSELNQTQDLPDGHEEQQVQPLVAGRRQSTRNRPLTTKALEALEYSFLNSKRKRKNMEYSHNNSKSQCLRASGDNGSGNVMADTITEKENEIRALDTSSSSISINLNDEPHYDL